MKIAVIGAGGQLGSDLVKVFGTNTIPLIHQDIEVTDPISCEVLMRLKPDVVINCAAFHKVDACEDFPEKTFQVNSLGARNVASIASKIGALNIFISTDYVFDGMKGKPYIETDITNPINVYGVSKVAGETFTRNFSDKHYVVRTASLFGVTGSSGKGGNFVETMIKKADGDEEIKVIDDMVMSPTYTLDLAQKIKELIEHEAPHGIYHITNDGFCSWNKFAETIFELLDRNIKVGTIKTGDLNLKAPRPPNSSLSNDKLKSIDIKLDGWKEGLKKYLEEKGHLK